MKRTIIGSMLLVFVLSIFFNANFARAYEIKQLKDVKVENDFVLGGALKIDLALNPGEEKTEDIIVTNRLGREDSFYISVEDAAGSNDPSQSNMVLLGDERGPYSVKDFVQPEASEIVLKHGEQVKLPVKFSIPNSASPGGYYGAVIVTIKKGQNKEGENKANVMIQQRLAAPIYLRVKGAADENGMLKDFYSSKKFYDKGPVKLTIVYDNLGNIHLVPYGKIIIKNFLGKKIGELNVEKYYVMPDSIRYKEMEFNRKLLIGKYSATLQLNRGYSDVQDIIDSKTISFWVVPWKLLAVVLAIVILAVWLIVSIKSQYKIARR